MLHPLTGSEWRIWDLHVHTPASFGGDDYDSMITNIAQSDAAVIGINDYQTLEGYKKIMLKGGIPGKVLFPVVEFRMHNIVANRKSASAKDGGQKINFHLIFTNDAPWFDPIERWLNSVECINEAGLKTQLGNISAADRGKVSVNFDKLLDDLKTVHIGKDCLRDQCLVWLPYDEYGGIDDIDPEDNFFKMRLIRQADIMGSSREKQIDFFKWRHPKFKKEHFITFMDDPKPCIKGSDAHGLHYPFGKLKDKDNLPVERYCWIKADTTFNGLKQILFEPDRVYIGKEPELLARIKALPHKFISKLEVSKEDDARTNEVWFDNFELPLNAGLTAVIGRKGNGKSAIADIIGLCAGSKVHSQDLSFLQRDKFKNQKQNKARDFAAKLSWLDNATPASVNLATEFSDQNEERAKYIPQNYLEKLCVNEEEKDFEGELKKIIFSHIPSNERLNQGTLDELITEKRKSIVAAIAQSQTELSKVNKEIVRLQVKMKPNYRNNLLEEITNKEKELEYHLQNKPPEQTQPDQDPEMAAANQKTLAIIEEHKKKIRVLNEQLIALNSEINRNNIALNDLESSQQDIRQVKIIIDSAIEEKRAVLSKYSIDINQVVNYTINLEPVTQAITTINDRNAVIQRTINGDGESIRGVSKEMQDMNIAVTGMSQQLDQPQKAFQVYLQTLESWEKRRKEMIGSVGVSGSLAYLQNELNYVDQKLEGELNVNVEKRLQIARKIFASKKEQLEIYNNLYRPVTDFILQEASFAEDYNIRVSASLIVKGFADRFLGFINQKSRGTYSGSMEGFEMLSQIVGVHSFDNLADVEHFLADMVVSLQTDKRNAYDNEKRFADEQLKKDIYLEDLYDYVFGLSYLEPQFKLQLGMKDLKELSPGERGAILLIFYLFLDIDSKPLVIDQPEENLDNESIYNYLVHYIKKAKEKRQIILITHNPNLAVVCDAEQIIQMTIDKQKGNKVDYISGAIENPDIARKVIDILEGTKPAFDNRRLKYALIGT